jgi:hypothetical protein
MNCEDNIINEKDNNEYYGYIYVLYNPIFNFYGECYKVGCTNNIESRIKSYSTSYPEPCELKYTSVKLKYYYIVESMIHKELKEYRMNSRREFFKCSLEVIKEAINKIQNKPDVVEKKALEDIRIKKEKEIELKNKPVKTFLKKNIILEQKNKEKEIVLKYNSSIKNTNIEYLINEINGIILNTEDTKSIEYNCYNKIYYCLEFVKKCGFSSIDDEKKVLLDYKDVYEYCRENEENIRIVFAIKQMEWSGELDANQKISLSRYINHKIESMFGINIGKINRGGNIKEYCIKKLNSLDQ